jgi:hypothetical protein
VYVRVREGGAERPATELDALGPREGLGQIISDVDDAASVLDEIARDFPLLVAAEHGPFRLS